MGNAVKRSPAKRDGRFTAVLVVFQGRTLSPSREGRAHERSSCALTRGPQQDQTLITWGWEETLPSRAGCAALLWKGFSERTVSAAGGPG